MASAVRSRHVLLCACVALAAAVGCDWYPAPTQTVIPPTTKSTIAVKATGAFVDSKTNAPVTTALSVKVLDASGSAATGIQDSNGRATTSFAVSSGLLNFAVDPNATFPKNLTVVVTGAGYLSSSARLKITGPGTYDFVASLVAVGDAPAGAKVIQTSAGTSSSTGALTADASIATPPESVSGGTVALSIPAGTVVTSASGTPLTGSLTATAAYFNNTSPEALAAFPGGFTGITATTQAGGTTSGAFVTAAFAALSIADSAGNLAAHFSTPISLSMDLPHAAVNPTTGTALSNGDLVPLWSYNEANGKWRSEGNVPVTVDGSGNVTANATINHFSYFTIAWLLDDCAVSRNIVIAGNTAGAPLTLTVQVGASGGGFQVNSSATTTVALPGVPSDVPMTATAYYNGQAIGTVTIDNLCDTGDVTLTVTIPSVTPATLTVTIVDECQGSATSTPVPSAGVSLSQAVVGQLPILGSTDTVGVATFSGLTAGQAFTITGENRTSPTVALTQAITLVAGPNTVTLTNPVTCGVISGSFGQ